MDDADFLRHRAVAAWRTGRGADLAAAVGRLDRLNAGDLGELKALAALGRAARDQRLRQPVLDGPGATSFDPRMRVPVIEVKVNGEAQRFFLDTGAEISVIDARAADRLAVRRPEGAEVTTHGNTGDVRTPMGLVARLEALGRAVEEVPVIVADLSNLPPQLGVSGILGAQDLFREGVLGVDYVAGRITRSASSSQDGMPIAFPYGRAIVAVEAAVEGGPVGLFRVDTGGRRSVLTNEYVDAALAAGARWTVSAPQAVEVRGIGAASRPRRTLSAGRFCSAGLRTCVDLADVPVDTTSADSLIAYAGKLGADAFAGRRLELDYTALRVRLTEPAATQPGR